MSKNLTRQLGKARSLQTKPGEATTTIVNADGDVIAWDAVKEACHCTTFCNKDEMMTAREAADHFKIDQQAIYGRAKRYKWKLVNGSKRFNEARRAAIDWAKRGEDHRELAFQIGHQSVKRFKPRAPKNFRELEIADRITRKAAGLETAEIVNQTLVHINEAIEDHGDQQVVEANVVEAEEALPESTPEPPALPAHSPDQPSEPQAHQT